jgi:hypothetical protein
MWRKKDRKARLQKPCGGQAAPAVNSIPPLYPFIRFVIPPSQAPVSIVVQYSGEDQFHVYTQPLTPSPRPSPLEGEGDRERGNPFNTVPEEIGK